LDGRGLGQTGSGETNGIGFSLSGRAGGGGGIASFNPSPGPD